MSILVPLDLSDVGACAVPMAVDLAAAFGDDLVFLTVLDDRLVHEVEVLGKVDRDGVEQVVGRQLEDTVAAIDAVVTRFEVVIADKAASAIVERASADDVDMVVIASNGRSGISRVLMGSVAESVTRHSPVPVTVVPAQGRGEG